MSAEPFAGLQIALGPLVIRETVLTTWGMMACLFLGARLGTRRLRLDPGIGQVVLEGIVVVMEDAVRAVIPEHADEMAPFVSTLWIFIAVANLVGLVPGLSLPTSDLSLTSGLAMVVFVSVHVFGLRAQGVRRYLRYYLTPNPILLPFHLISEGTRTLALAVRLFGNMMSLDLAALLVLLVAEFLAPVPLLMLHIVEAVVQAYIFGMLALIYIAGAVQTLEAEPTTKES
jgi:F-type H+-transporting ATPase subunit a